LQLKDLNNFGEKNYLIDCVITIKLPLNSLPAVASTVANIFPIKTLVSGIVNWINEK
jgi:hypothetical protein